MTRSDYQKALAGDCNGADEAQPQHTREPQNGHLGARDAYVTLTYETALQHGFSGLWWSSVAAYAGSWAAAAYPLVQHDEAEAQRFAKAVVNPTKEQFEDAQNIIDSFTERAVAAFHVCVPQLRQSEAAHPVPERLDRETDDALSTVEWLGRTAAKSARILFLLTRENGRSR